MQVATRSPGAAWQSNGAPAPMAEPASTPPRSGRRLSTGDLTGLAGSITPNSAAASDVASSPASTPREGFAKQGPGSAYGAYGAGQSLTTVLNNPRLGKSGVYGNDATWAQWIAQAQKNGEQAPEGPPPLPDSITDVSINEFAPYLSQIAEPYKKFFDVSRHALQEQSRVGFSADGEEEDKEDKEQEEAERTKGRLTSVSSKQRAASRGEGLSTCLQEVPPIYFNEDFALEQKETFQTVCPSSSIPSSMLLQEKLSHYLDLVEVQLVKEISSRSESFFEALEQLEDLNSRIVDTCSQIGQLRSSVSQLDADLLEGARDVQAMRMRREHLLSLHNKLKLVDSVHEALSTLKLLVSSNDCAGALDVIDDLHRLSTGDELKGLHCFRDISDSLSSATDSVNKVLSAEFLRAAVHSKSDIEPPTVVVAAYQRRQKAGGTVSLDAVLALETSGAEERLTALKEQLLPVILGLLRTSKLPSVLKAYREALNADIKAAIKAVVGELLPVLYVKGSEAGGGLTVQGDSAAAAAADVSDGAPNLALKLRGLSGEAFVQLLLAVFEAVQSRLVRASDLRKVVEQTISGEDVDAYTAEAVAAALAQGAVKAAKDQRDKQVQSTKEGRDGGKSSSPTEAVTSGSQPAGSVAAIAGNTSKQLRAEVMRENAEAVADACDVAHGRWAKLLGVRAHQHARLSLADFVDFYSLTSHFIAATERVGGRLGYSIRGALQSQAKAFVDTFHASKVAKLNSCLDKEVWAAVDAPPEAQKLIKFFETDAADGQPPASPKDRSMVNGKGANGVEVETSPAAKADGKKEGGGEEGKAGKKVTKTVVCHGENYHVCNSLLEVLTMTREYMTVSESLPMLAGEVVHRLSDILKLFNSRTCQLVLGAGAMQISGLKSITAKHLALSSQCISLIFALLPDIRRILASYVPDARRTIVLSQLERVSQDYRVHRDEIHSKLVAIMRERLLVHLKSLPAVIEGYAKPDEPDAPASNFARALTKEVGVLYRILAPLLLESDLRSIFTRVVSLFHAQLADSFSKIDTPTETSKIKMQRDISLILKCLRSLPTNSVPRHENKPRELEQLLINKFGTPSSAPTKSTPQPNQDQTAAQVETSMQHQAQSPQQQELGTSQTAQVAEVAPEAQNHAGGEPSMESKVALSQAPTQAQDEPAVDEPAAAVSQQAEDSSVGRSVAEEEQSAAQDTGTKAPEDKGANPEGSVVAPSEPPQGKKVSRETPEERIVDPSDPPAVATDKEESGNTNGEAAEANKGNVVAEQGGDQ